MLLAEFLKSRNVASAAEETVDEVLLLCNITDMQLKEWRTNQMFARAISKRDPLLPVAANDARMLSRLSRDAAVDALRRRLNISESRAWCLYTATRTATRIAKTMPDRKGTIPVVLHGNTYVTFKSLV
jgi:transcription elongation GreA/GreB family factor